MNDWKKQLQQISKENGFAATGQDAKGKGAKQNMYNKNNDNGQKQKSHDTNGNKNNKENNANNAGGKNSEGYVGAPYNFVPFYDKVYPYPKDKLTAHNEAKDSLITGEITYEIKAETPIMIGDGDKGSKENPHPEHFFKDAKGRYAIPGSTMRGLIRNNVQVLGLCSYDDDIDDYELMYRNVANGVERVQYNNTLGSKPIPVEDGNKTYKLGVLLNVHAGYVFNEDGKYVIYQTAVDSIKKEFKGMNYYVLSERKIVNDYLKYGDSFSYGFFRQKGKSILEHEFQKFVHYKGRDNKDHYKGEKNKDYKPYYKPVSYEVAHEKDIIAVGAPNQYKHEGYAVSTGKMNEKKAVYIIPQIDKSKDSILIPEKDVRAFRIDLKKKENTLKQFGGKEYFDLPEEGEMRPIFYIQLGGRLYFGFTPRLRLFYDHKVKEGLKQEWKDGNVDYGKALFGYASKDKSYKSYKSKLSFSDAVLKEGIEESVVQKLILAEPKSTSCLDYLKQNSDNSVTYNTDDFELRGAKQYWLHDTLVPAEVTAKSEKVASKMYPLKKGAIFTGKIRFQNLTEDELGLLLWAVRLKDGSQMNVGKAKAYGYGRISVTILEAKKLDLKNAYKTDGVLCLDPFCQIDIDSAIESYKTEINKHLGKKTIDELPHIRDFFIMKDSEKIPDNKRTRYMKIKNEKDENEFQKRKKPLPTIRSVSEGKE